MGAAVAGPDTGARGVIYYGLGFGINIIIIFFFFHSHPRRVLALLYV